MTIYLEDSLFDPVPPVTAGTARKRDPWSSRESARRTKPEALKARILAAFVANGGRGTLDTACDAVPETLRGTVSRRITDLAQDGKVVETGRYEMGRYGQPLAVWEVR